MSWTKIKNFIIISSISLVILFILESVSSIAFYQLKKPNTYFFSSTVETLKRLTEGKLKNPKFSFLRLEVINAERAKGVEAYPSYLFEPQLQHPSDFVYLSNVANKTIIDCNENHIKLGWNPEECAVFPMLENKTLKPFSLSRIYFSLLEADDTSKISKT